MRVAPRLLRLSLLLPFLLEFWSERTAPRTRSFQLPPSGFFNASPAARCVACHSVRSHPVPVALVGQWLHTLSRRTWPASPARHTESREGRGLGGASPQRCVQSQPTSPATCGESGERGRRRAAGEWRTRRLPGGTGRWSSTAYSIT